MKLISLSAKCSGLLLLSLMYNQTNAQTINEHDTTKSLVATLYGKVTNEKKEGIDFASILILQGGVLKGGTKTDINGNYRIKIQAYENYDVLVKCAGYREQKIEALIVNTIGRHNLNVELETKNSDSSNDKIIITSFPPGKKMNRVELNKPILSDVKHNKSEVFGRVTNARGKGIAGVKVKFESLIRSNPPNFSKNTNYMIDGIIVRGAKNQELYAITDSNGNYSMSNLYPGTWKISFRRRGYKSYEVMGLKLGEYKQRFVATLQSGHDSKLNDDIETTDTNKEILLSNQSIYKPEDFNHLPANNMEEMIDLLDRNRVLSR